MPETKLGSVDADRTTECVPDGTTIPGNLATLPQDRMDAISKQLRELRSQGIGDGFFVNDDPVNGRIVDIKSLHDRYLSGALTDPECEIVDLHLFLFDNDKQEWNQLTRELEATFPCEVHEIKDGEDVDESV